MNWRYWAGALRLDRIPGVGHWCEYDNPSAPGYVGFTAGICYKRGLHRGRKP